MIDANDALLAVVIRARLWHAEKQERSGQRGSNKERFSEQRESREMSHTRFFLLY
jgi:hypothetical protein